MNTETRPKIVPLTTNGENMTPKFDWAEKKRLTEEQIRKQNEENLRNISQKAFRETLAQGITIQELEEIMQNDPQLLEFCGNIRIQIISDEIRTRSSLTPAKTGIKRARIKFVEHDGVRLSERAAFVLGIIASEFKNTKFTASNSLATHIFDLPKDQPTLFSNLSEASVRQQVHQAVSSELLKYGLVSENGKEGKSHIYRVTSRGLQIAQFVSQNNLQPSVVVEDDEDDRDLNADEQVQLQEDIENAVALEQ